MQVEDTRRVTQATLVLLMICACFEIHRSRRSRFGLGRDLDHGIGQFRPFHRQPVHKSQKRAEADKKIEKALNELSTGQFQSVYEAAYTNNFAYTTLLRRMNGGKSTAESHKPQQILTIPKKNVLASVLLILQLLDVH